MKTTKQMDNLQELLKSGRLVSGGFLGTDIRHYIEIIDDDAAELSRLNISAERLAERMREITGEALKGLGSWMKVGEDIEAKIDEAKGGLVCPWPHEAGFIAKRVTTIRRLDSGCEMRWSDLCIHLIGEHGFFQGMGSKFRIEPRELAEMVGFFRG